MNLPAPDERSGDITVGQNERQFGFGTERNLSVFAALECSCGYRLAFARKHVEHQRIAQILVFVFHVSFCDHDGEVDKLAAHRVLEQVTSNEHRIFLVTLHVVADIDRQHVTWFGIVTYLHEEDGCRNVPIVQEATPDIVVELYVYEVEVSLSHRAEGAVFPALKGARDCKGSVVLDVGGR